MKFRFTSKMFYSRMCWIIATAQLSFLIIMWFCLSSPTLPRRLDSSQGNHKTDEKYLYDKLKENQNIKNTIDRCDIKKKKNKQCLDFLLDGRGTEPSRSNTKKLTNKECALEKLLENCDIFRLVHGYISYSIKEEEENFPLAFSMKLHKNPEQAEQILRTIYRPHNVYCIYIDKKSSLNTYETFVNLSKCFENIYVIEERSSIVYASIYHVYAELQCMTTVLKSNIKWRYYINLTGQEFPLKTNLEIVKILKALNGANDVESFKFPYYLKFRVQQKYRIFKNYMVRTNKTKGPLKYNIDLRKGSAYGMFKREFVKYVIEDNVARDFIQWTADTLSPEETVWSTLNSLPWAPGGYQVETKHSSGTFLSRAMIWKWDKIGCSGKFIRHVCIFGIRDLPWLSFRREIFANKFDRSIDSLAVDCLEEVIRNRTYFPDPSPLDFSYYQNIPQAQVYRNFTNTDFSQSRLLELKMQWLEKQVKRLKQLKRMGQLNY